MLDCDEELSDEPGKNAAPIAEAFQLLLQASIPPVLRTGAPGNVLLQMEREFEGLVAELQTACGIPDPAGLSYFRFLQRVDHFEELMKRRKQ